MHCLWALRRRRHDRQHDHRQVPDDVAGGVRKVLGVGLGDRLAYIVDGDHAVIMKAKRLGSDEDPVVDAFLAFIERDMTAHSDRLAGLTTELVERARALTDGIEADPDRPIEGDVAI